MKNSKYFATSDGEQFYNEGDAKNHAKTLTDKTVTPPTADVADIETNSEDVSGDSSKKGTSKIAPVKTAGPKLEEPFTLDAFNAEAENAYEAGKVLVKELKLKPATNKKKDIFAVLAAAKIASQKPAPQVPAETPAVEEQNKA